MIKCPFCSFENEEGALFCEQCKSDLSSVPSTPVAPAAAAPIAAAEVIEEVVPLEPIDIPVVPVEPVPIESIALEPIAAEAVVPVEPVPVEAIESVMPIETETAPPAPPPAPEPPPVAAAPPAPAPAPPAPPPAPAPAPAPAAPTAAFFTPDAKPLLKVLRGLKIGTEYPLYEGNNFIGRADEQPVDIDLEPQEPPDRVWTSRQHALVTFEKGILTLEDLNSSNGTFLNRARVHPGQPQALKVGDVIQIGTVQLKVQA